MKFEDSVGATAKDVSVEGPTTPADREPHPEQRRYYVVESYFDGQNSAGAMIRQRYSCFAQWNAPKGEWSVGVTMTDWAPR